MNKIIWLDDIREPFSSQWDLLIRNHFGNNEVIWVKNYSEFVSVINSTNDIVGISFDNDLGEEKEGKDCFNYFEAFVRENSMPKIKLMAHTANPAAKKYLELGFSSLNSWWNSQYKS